MKTILTITTILTLLFPALTATAGEVTTSDNTTFIKNTEPAFLPVELELKELWRRGGEDDEVMIGLPVEALSDEEGRVYLADQQLCQIFVFNEEGELEKTLSREGEGPGEVQGPIDMVRLPDGTIGLAEFFPGKIIKMTYDDLPAGEITVDVSGGKTGGFTIQTMAEAQGDHLVMAGSRSLAPGKIHRAHPLPGRHRSERRADRALHGAGVVHPAPAQRGPRK